MTSFFLALLLPFIATLLIPLAHAKLNDKMHIGWLVIFVPALVFWRLLSFIPTLVQGDTVYYLLPWIPSYQINLAMQIDGLSLLFGLIISGIGILVVLYSIYYLSRVKEDLHNFYVYILIFMGAMLGLVFSDNIFVLYSFWELTSISSFLLIAYWFERDKSRAGARKSMMITIFGGLSMLAGFIMLSLITGTTYISEMLKQVTLIQGHDLFIPAMILILLGAFTKSAQFPFSIWLPDAMEAPTPVSAFLHSATMVKAGIYLVARMTAIFAGTMAWFWLVTLAGLITLLYGSVNAVRQTDLKALLAFSTISQLGMIMSLLGLGSAALYYDVAEAGVIYALAIFTALFHLFNHATFKGALFMVIGIIDHELGTRDIRKLGGLLEFMPVSFTLALIGSFAMAGLPPFNGFLSKELFFTSLVNASNMTIFAMPTWGKVFLVLGWIASVFTFIYSMTMLWKTFLGQARKEDLVQRAHEAVPGMYIAPSILAAFVILIFFIPNFFVNNLISPAWQAVLPTMASAGLLEVHVAAWHGMTTELYMTIALVVLGTFMYMTISKWYVFYRYYPERLMLNSLYDASFEMMERVSRKVTKKYMTDSLRDYIVYIFIFMIILVGGSLVFNGGISLLAPLSSEVSYYELAVLAGMLVSALVVIRAEKRMTAIIGLSSLGFLVMFAFMLFRAPDLALTQLVVETVTTVLFLLCFRFLPQMQPDRNPKSKKIANALISIAVGILVTVLALSAHASKYFESISGFYEQAYELAGGRNIVNVILVDFRGYDTMLEILVLTMAGIGVYTLVKVNRRKGAAIGARRN